MDTFYHRSGATNFVQVRMNKQIKILFIYLFLTEIYLFVSGNKVKAQNELFLLDNQFLNMISIWPFNSKGQERLNGTISAIYEKPQKCFSCSSKKNAH
jgi:hypothetical protein